jgi:hypothetical protein
VLNAAEVNRVDWAIDGAHGATVTNDVLPSTQVCCDVYSYSYWDSSVPHQPDVLIQHLDYIKTKAPDKPPFGRSNVILAEFGGGQNNEYCTPVGQCSPGTEGDAEAQKEGMRRIVEAGLGWGCPLVVYWQLYDVGDLRDGLSLPSTTRPTNAQLGGGWVVPPDGSQRPLYTYLQNLSSAGILRVGLQSSGGYYVSANNGGGGAVYVGAPWLRQWEDVTIVDINGGLLQTGDIINLLTHDGHYLMAQNNGGGVVDATSTHALTWEQFVVLKQNGSGPIVAGDTVALRAGGGQYVTASGGGSSTTVLSAASNSVGTSERFKLVTIPTSCSYAISPSQQSAPAAGGTFTFTITTSAGCGWTAAVTSGGSFLSLLSSPDGSGTATLTYSVASNSSTARTGTIVIGSMVLTISQAAPCTYTVSPSSITRSAAAGSGTISVISSAGCVWSAFASGSFITITGGASGAGNGTVSYAVTQNTGAGRSGTITVAGNVIPLAQAGTASAGFYILTPCRVFDTRGADGPYGGPALQPGAVRSVHVTGVCGITANADSIALNVTVVSPTVGGYITVYPGPATNPPPNVSTLNYQPGWIRATNTIVHVAADGSINVYNAGSTAVHFFVDVTGQFQ